MPENTEIMTLLWPTHERNCIRHVAGAALARPTTTFSVNYDSLPSRHGLDLPQKGSWRLFNDTYHPSTVNFTCNTQQVWGVPEGIIINGKMTAAASITKILRWKTSFHLMKKLALRGKKKKKDPGTTISESQVAVRRTGQRYKKERTQEEEEKGREMTRDPTAVTHLSRFQPPRRGSRGP